MSREAHKGLSTGRVKQVKGFIRREIVFPKYNLVIGGVCLSLICTAVQEAQLKGSPSHTDSQALAPPSF